jgi:hypothetical protein
METAGRTAQQKSNAALSDFGSGPALEAPTAEFKTLMPTLDHKQTFRIAIVMSTLSLMANSGHALHCRRAHTRTLVFGMQTMK